MLKLYYLDRLETKLSKAKIEERLKDIILEDKFFNIQTRGKKLWRGKFGENIYSFFYLPERSRGDMLMPRIHMTILEKKEGCICNLYYSRTWGLLCTFIWWSFFWGSVVFVSALRSNFFSLICYMTVYILGIWMAKKHCNSICKKVVHILEVELNCNENIS